MKLTAKLATLAALASLGVPLVGGFAGSANADIIYPLLKPNLTVSATATKVTVWNKGYVAAGPFKVAISTGYQGDQCGWKLPAYSVDIAGLPARSYKTFSVQASDWTRSVYADYLNSVNETSELDNSAVIPSTPVVC